MPDGVPYIQDAVGGVQGRNKFWGGPFKALNAATIDICHVSNVATVWLAKLSLSTNDDLMQFPG